jgi:serine/threonine protein kinase
MRVKHVPCGPFANHSEQHALEFLKARLISVPDADWVLLSNVELSGGDRLPYELDLIAIGPSGAHVIEIKHWSRDFAKEIALATLENEAAKLNSKVKRLAGILRRFDLGFLAGKFLFTGSETDKFAATGKRQAQNGVEIFGLQEWRELLQVSGPRILSSEQILAVAKQLVPAATPTLSPDIRAFEEFADLQRQPESNDFRRIYRAKRRRTGDRLLLHLYDLSATEKKNAEGVARREFEILQKLQKSAWLPSIMDSFQEASSYPGELCFFTYVDPEAPTLQDRSEDATWTLEARVVTLQRSIEALIELHTATPDAIFHRNLRPTTIRVRATNEPIFTQLHLAKIVGTDTVVSQSDLGRQGYDETVAPEVRTNGYSTFTPAADTFALCASFRAVLEGFTGTETGTYVRSLLERGCDVDAASRISLAELRDALQNLARPPRTVPATIPAAYWDDQTVRPFNGRWYRIIAKLGAGGVGITFKVMEVDEDGQEELSGPYVAKVFTNASVADAATRAYAKVRAQTGGLFLAGVLEVASHWRANEISALLRWVKGEPLHAWKGVLPLYLAEIGDADDLESTALSWVRELAQGLAALHAVSLIHGDVSPKNIILDGTSVVLTDFDLVTSIGGVPAGGTPQYCSQAVQERRAVTPADDIFALAASIFEVVTDVAPFEFNGTLSKTRGANIAADIETLFPRLSAFVRRATHPDEQLRFPSGTEAAQFVASLLTTASSATEVLAPPEEPPTAPVVLTENYVPWLAELLQSYPGSRRGNAETRGLDSEFAKQTYVETPLDEQLRTAILAHEISLLILCGNAGDGKTAFLQHLAATLGIETGTSAQRVWEARTGSGLRIKANLDGSAAYRDKSAPELLDDIFGPFRDGAFPPGLTHIVAINDGPLVAWLEEAGEDWLTQQLEAALDPVSHTPTDPRIRLIDLNNRSLVGRIQPASPTSDADVTSTFVDTLLDRMLGADNPWAPCLTCTVQTRCHAWTSVQTLRDEETGPVVRTRLNRALRAAHQRGDIHITARELRSALTYIFFGTDYCADLHARPEYVPLAYSDRAFANGTPHRQGLLLKELQLFDPALDTHPRIDRELLRAADPAAASSLASLRRRAYFEWSPARIREVGGNERALDLARGTYLEDFVHVASGSHGDVERICTDLCRGVARLEDLPDRAFVDPNVVPLRIAARAATESALWVAKPRNRFTLAPERERGTSPMFDTLHTHVVLTYAFASGHREALHVSLDLFHLLMELNRGFQLSDIHSDDVFAHLATFKQRVAQENDTSVLAWNPLDRRIFTVEATPDSGRQVIQIRREGAPA